jgi:hypothetical protein
VLVSSIYCVRIARSRRNGPCKISGPYLISLIICRKSPPVVNGRIDWATIADTCGIGEEITEELKKQLRPGFDSITRWLGAPAALEDVRPPRPKTELPRPDIPTTTSTTSSAPKRERLDSVDTTVQGGARGKVIESGLGSRLVWKGGVHWCSTRST